MKDPMIKNVSVFGAGLMGSGISQVFAAGGYQVTTYDIVPADQVQLFEKIRSNLEVMAEGQADLLADIDKIIGRVTYTTDFQKAAETADFVVECIPENLDMKQEMFSALDRLCKPEAILASNTSVISITEIAAKSVNKNRIIGSHFWNPPFLLPLVEVVQTEFTAADVMERAMNLFRDVGKHPIHVRKDVPGFVANRLQHALWREAISIVEKGIADAETVDSAIKYSFGMRLPVLAPLENADMVGTDLTLSIHDYVLKHLESSPEASPLLKKKVEEGNLGFKTGQGFMKWSEKDIEASRTRLIQHLLKMQK
jgi:3-hydroxybutyryl-CoA dehydrogenase